MAEGMVLQGIRRAYRGGAGLSEVGLEVHPGEIHALVGMNGAGKSTLMKVLLGMLRPEFGSARLGGEEVQAATPKLWRRVGQLVETSLAYPEFTVTRNLLVNATLRGVPAVRRKAMVARAIDDFGLGEFAANRTRTLSSGNRQRLGLAAALQHLPEFVVLDEPTNALDPAGTILLRDTLRERADVGAAILISSHHLDEVARIADTITVMNAGRLIGRLQPDGTELERAFFALVLRDDEERRAKQEANG